jgi:hypothetical protein
VQVFYAEVLGGKLYAIATLEPEQRRQALGLLPDEAPGMVVLAYRRGPVQCLLQIPEDRYDAERLLEVSLRHEEPA